MAQREQPQVLPGFVDDIQTLLENWQQVRVLNFYYPIIVSLVFYL